MPRTAARRYRHFEPAHQQLPGSDSSTAKRSKSCSAQPHPSTESPPLPVINALHLPTEILLHILSFVPHSPTSQTTLASFCLVSRAWYSAAVSRLYEKPHIHGKNFDPFVRTICPSINAHVRKSELAELVKVLDLGGLVHHGSKSVTARLLGRTKANLHTFAAPQASFGLNCIAALSKCHQLRVLDLRLISESIGLHDIIHALSQLRNLSAFAFPRCSLNHADSSLDHISWPPRLASLAPQYEVERARVKEGDDEEGLKSDSSAKSPAEEEDATQRDSLSGSPAGTEEEESRRNSSSPLADPLPEVLDMSVREALGVDDPSAAPEQVASRKRILEIFENLAGPPPIVASLGSEIKIYHPTVGEVINPKKRSIKEMMRDLRSRMVRADEKGTDDEDEASDDVAQADQPLKGGDDGTGADEGTKAAPGAIKVEEEELDDAVHEELPDANTKATLDMIITIAGELYGQKDLLEFRDVWATSSDGNEDAE